MLISLNNAGIYRSDRCLVRGVSMTIDAGEIVTLIGPNGSGKSTTAKMALGILRTDEGTARQKPNLRTSYVPQKLEVNWTLPLSVTRFLQLTNRATQRQVEDALSATETDHLADAQPFALPPIVGQLLEPGPVNRIVELIEEALDDGDE